jgi:hypothetical protein
VSDDPQDQAEALDEDVVDPIDDRGGVEFGNDLPDYPPDRPMGVNTVGVTPAEEDAGESFAERTFREEPDEMSGLDAELQAGQLVEPTASSLDDEEELIGEEEPAEDLSAEEAAMHIEREP